MSHGTKQIICGWFLDGFKLESEYAAEVRAHFTDKELEKIDELHARQYTPDVRFTKKEKAFILYALTVVMMTSKQGGEDEHEY